MANEIRSICADRHGMLWLGTFDGLYRFNPTDNSFVRYETRSRKLPNDTYNNLVNALYIPENTPDLLYVGSSSGLVVLDIRHPEQPLGTLRAEDGGLTDNDIKSILSYDDTHLLLATADGLTLYDTRSCRPAPITVRCPTRRRCPTTRCARFSATGRTSSGSAPTADWPNSTSNARRSTASA